MSLRYDVGKQWAAHNTKFSNNYFSSLLQPKHFEKRFVKDEDPRENHTNTTKNDLNKGYLIEIPDAPLTRLRTGPLVPTTLSGLKPK